MFYYLKTYSNTDTHVERIQIKFRLAANLSMTILLLNCISYALADPPAVIETTVTKDQSAALAADPKALERAVEAHSLRTVSQIALNNVTAKNLVSSDLISMVESPAPSTSASPALSIQFGGIDNYAKKSNTSYFNIAAFGAPMYTLGSAPTFSSFSTSGLADVSNYQAYLTVQAGTTKFGGSLLQGASTNNLGKMVPALKCVNLVAGIDQQFQSADSTTYIFEVEQANKFANTSGSTSAAPSNDVGFLVFGFGDERLTPSGSSTSDQYGPTVRGLISQEFFLSKRAKANASYVKSVAKQIKDLTETTNSAKSADLDTFAITDDLKRTLSATAVSAGESLSSRANVVIWADGNARYALGQRVGSAFRGIYSLNAKLSLDEIANAPYVQIQYLDGEQAATPNTRSESFQFLVGVSF